MQTVETIPPSPAQGAAPQDDLQALPAAFFGGKKPASVKGDVPLVVLVDSREQRPFTFDAPTLPAVEVQRATLKTGDYSLEGLESLAAVERKSLDDLVGCLCRGRARFERELVRGASMARFMVVVESPWLDLARGKYRSRMNPLSAVESVMALQARHCTPFIFAGSREAAQYLTFSWLKHCQKELAAMMN